MIKFALTLVDLALISITALAWHDYYKRWWRYLPESEKR